MGNGAIPPLPPGFTLDKPSAAPAPDTSQMASPPTVPPLPPGFTLDKPGATGAAGVLSGIGGGIIGTAAGLEGVVNKALPSSMQIPKIPEEYYKQRTTSEKIGGGLETIGEFLIGDEALKGLSLADRFGLSAKVAQIAQQSPRLAKALEMGMNAVRQGTVTGTQGAVGAAAEGQPIAPAAAAGAAGGTLGALGGEVVGAGLTKAGESLEGFAPKIGNALLQANKVKNFQYGKNPGRVFVDEDIARMAVKPWESYADVAKSIEEAGDNIKAEALGTLSSSPNAQTRISVAPQIHQIFDDALDEVSKKSGLPDRKGLIADLDNLRSEMTENFDARGNSTGTKGPMSPQDITKLKTNVGRGTKWDLTKNAESQQFLNNVRKRVYAYLDSEVDKAVPQMEQINARWANQIEAEQLVQRRVAQEQAAAYGHSKAVSRSVIGAGAALILHGDPLAGGALILNEAARTPAGRIASMKAATVAGKVLARPAGAVTQKAGALAGASAAEQTDATQPLGNAVSKLYDIRPGESSEDYVKRKPEVAVRAEIPVGKTFGPLTDAESIRLGAKDFSEQAFKESARVRVRWPDGMTHVDEVKGMNQGHAVWRAMQNWIGAQIEYLGKGSGK